MHSRVKNKIDVTSLQNRLPSTIYDNCYIISELLEAEELVMQEPNATTFLSNLEKAPYVCFAGAKTTDETGSVFYTWNPPAEVNLSEGTARVSAEALMISLHI